MVIQVSKYYVDVAGNYLGSMINELAEGDKNPYAAAIEVPVSPPDATHLWDFDKQAYVATEKTYDLLRENAKSEVARLMSAATLAILPLQYVVDSGDAQPGEVEQFNRWKLYLVDLSRVDHQESFPISIEWPLPPDSV